MSQLNSKIFDKIASALYDFSCILLIPIGIISYCMEDYAFFDWVCGARRVSVHADFENLNGAFDFWDIIPRVVCIKFLFLGE